MQNATEIRTARSNGHAVNGSGHVSPESRAEVYALRDFGDVECRGSVDLVIYGFSSFGRLAHLRHWLLSRPHVSWARITGYVNQTALLSVGLQPGTPSAVLVPTGTRLISSDGQRLELSVNS